MDIHKPKPAHSLPEFARETGAVVLGILIALGPEQAVEAYHWRSTVAEARRVLNAEISSQTTLYAYRVASHPCGAMDDHFDRTVSDLLAANQS